MRNRCRLRTQEPATTLDLSSRVERLASCGLAAVPRRSDAVSERKLSLWREANLKKRTLTNLYDQRPTWLDLAHKKLD